MHKHVLVVLAAACAVFAHAAEFADKTVVLKAVRYDLDYRIDYEQELLHGAVRMELKSSANGVSTVPLLLYKLMTVHSVQNADGYELAFLQRNVGFEDRDSLEVKFIEVVLPEPVAKNRTITLDIRYSGHMRGYVESGMLYTRDSIDPYFTLLRLDCYAYPVVGYPNWKVNRAAGLGEFDYALTVRVPEGYVAASPGRLAARGSQDGRPVFTFQNMLPSWRMDAAVARYGMLEKGARTVYYLPGDADGAARVLEAMERCTELFTRWFGPLHRAGHFSVVEIPEGYGSQADVSGMLLTADAFHDVKRMHQLYHELSHQWNVRDTDPLPCRWNEGLATFLEWRAADVLHDTDNLDYYMDWMAGSIRQELEENPERAAVAPVDFGRRQIEGMSYTVGAVAFHILWGLVGEEEFNRILGGFYRERQATGATAREFVTYMKTRSSIDLTRYTNDWWLGTGWAAQMYEGKKPGELVHDYR